MANDIDMWNDIAELEKNGDQQQANDLLMLYHARFIEGNLDEAEKLRNEFLRRYGWMHNYW